MPLSIRCGRTATTNERKGTNRQTEGADRFPRLLVPLEFGGSFCSWAGTF
jgi:hypothetical protein